VLSPGLSSKGALFAAAGQSASTAENLTNLTTSHLLVPSAMGLLLSYASYQKSGLFAVGNTASSRGA
jgi:hypothetical protein